jgi:hypothetical protein
MKKMFIKAQALIELAIFGSILLTILGLLITYGLKYNFQQKTIQHAFRKALAEASSDMRSSQYSLIRDKHIPSPTDPFGVGSVISVSAGAGVVRNYRLDYTPDNDNELPKITMEFDADNEIKKSYKTAGFRIEYEVPQEAIPKYEEIYGRTNIQCRISGTEEWRDKCECEENQFLDVWIIDPYIGEYISYSGAIRQCRMLVDVDVCIQECKRGDGDNCEEVCNLKTNPPNQENPSYDPSKGGAWYCANYTEVDPTTHRYYFPVLEEMFAFALRNGEQIKPKTMGIQPENIQTNSLQNRLEVRQSQADITGTDTFNWQVTTARTIISHPYGDDTGSYVSDEITTTKGQNETRNW